uniref:FACT complex subunit n=1 Tax=Bursaphelenchus xylophilus TaxID=6326 RepID=A0A1I7SA86_BURXY
MARIDKDYFIKRATRLYERWNSGDDETLSKLSCLVFPVGTDDNYSKTQSLQTWLFNCAIFDTLLVFTKAGIYFLGSEKKARFFSPVESKENDEQFPPLNILHRDKASKDVQNFEKLIAVIKESGNSYGCFAKESFDSEFTTSWQDAVKESNAKAVDVTLSFALLFAVKDDKEISLMRRSAEATANAMNVLKKKIVNIVDTEKKVKHSRLADEMERLIVSKEVQGKLAQNEGSLEAGFTPIIQSGSKCALKFSANNSDSNISYGSVPCCLGMRFMSYCTNVARTFALEPADSYEKVYDTLLSIQQKLLKEMKPGNTISDVYKKTVHFIENEAGEISKFIQKANFGFATGIEFRDGQFLINEKCKQVLQPNMTFVVSIGAQDFPNPGATNDEYKTTSIWLSDTILVTKEGPCEVLTMSAKSQFKANAIRLKNSEDEQVKEVKQAIMDQGRSKRSVILQEQTRHKQTNEDRRRTHQKELSDQLNSNAKARLAHLPGTKDERKVKKSNISYKTLERFPNEPEVNDNMIYVDKRHDTVILPIFGMPVPFHISMLKNTSMANEGDYTYLRLNFTHPGSQIGKDNFMFPNPLADYVKELTFRSSNSKEPGEMHAPSLNLQTAYRLIKEMQKKFRTSEAEEREKEGAVKQDKLVLNNMKGNPKLKDLYVRPNIVKRMSGVLEAHQNGFRYTTPRGDKIDVLYNNIKHAFFQPCDNEMIILLHFNLRNPVLWGKKKYSDIQFYTEVGEITTDLGKYHHMQDRDDVASEQMEREMRKKLNSTFQNFCDKVAKATNEQVDFDTPFNDLSFNGVPFKSSVYLKPTSSCLVNLTEWPPFVVTLDEVELVHFERVSGNTRTCDMIIVFKDYTKKTQGIFNIPDHALDGIKDWLNSCDIRYSEGPMSLNWNNIMKRIIDDPEGFFEEGGWDFLLADSEDEGEDDDSEESEFNVSDDSDASGEEESESDSESVQTTSDSESEAELDSDESEGKDWSDLEEEAAKADKMKERGEEEAPSHGHKRKHGGGGGGSSSKKRR